MAIVSAPLGFNIFPDTDRFSKCIVLGGRYQFHPIK